MALGIYHLTGMVPSKEGESPKFYGSKDEAIGRYQMGEQELREEIITVVEGKTFAYQRRQTYFSMRLCLWEWVIRTRFTTRVVLPNYHPLFLINSALMLLLIILNNIEALGFRFATDSALTVGMDDFVISPKKRCSIWPEIEKQEDQLTHDYYDGLVTEEERRDCSRRCGWMSSTRSLMKNLERIPERP